MTFKGWIPLRRELVNLVRTRRLTTTEYAVLVTLNLLADHKTGKYTINVPTLMFYHPDLPGRTADRILRKLQNERLIYREIKYQSKRAYRYWVQGYEITEGVLKGKLIDLSEVFATKDISKLRYVESVADVGDEVSADVADSNNNEQVTSEQATNDKPPSPVCGETSLNESGSSDDGDRDVLEETALEPARSVPETNVKLPPPPPPPASGVDLRWSGDVYRDNAGREVPFDVALKRIRTLGLEFKEGTFYDGSGTAVPWEQAQQRITGIAPERRAA